MNIIGTNSLQKMTIMNVNRFIKQITVMTCFTFFIMDAQGQVCENCGIGQATPGSKLEIKGCGDDSTTSSLNVTDSNETSLLYVQDDGRVGLGTTSPTKLLDVRGAAVFNEGGADNDFRIEGDDSTNLFFIDASANSIGIGTTSPTKSLDVSNGAIFNSAKHDHDVKISGTTMTNLFVADAAEERIGIRTGAPTQVLDVRGGAIFNKDKEDYDFKISGDSIANLFIVDASTNNIGIGTAVPVSKLSINDPGESRYSCYVYNGSTEDWVGAIRAKVAPATDKTYHTYGLQASAYPGYGQTRAVYGQSYRSSPVDSGRSYGVQGYAGNTTDGFNYGVYGRLDGSRQGAGVFGTVSGDYDVDGTYAGYFKGLLATTHADPECSGGGEWSTLSDARLKTKVRTFSDGLDIIKQVNPVSYEYNGIGGYEPGISHIGIIAQELQPVAGYCITNSSVRIKEAEKDDFPGSSFVRSDTSGTFYNAPVLKYDGSALKYVMINAIKELSAKNDSLELEINAIKSRLMALESK